MSHGFLNRTHFLILKNVMILGFARIKHKESGLCWKVKDDGNIVLSSQCKDLFLFEPNSKILYKDTKQRVQFRTNGGKRTLYLNDNGHVLRFINGSTISWLRNSNTLSCLVEDDGNPTIEQEEINFDDFSCTKTSSIVTLLPGNLHILKT